MLLHIFSCWYNHGPRWWLMALAVGLVVLFGSATENDPPPLAPREDTGQKREARPSAQMPSENAWFQPAERLFEIRKLLRDERPTIRLIGYEAEDQERPLQGDFLVLPQDLAAQGIDRQMRLPGRLGQPVAARGL
jgi:hypothetical protein